MKVINHEDILAIMSDLFLEAITTRTSLNFSRDCTFLEEMLMICGNSVTNLTSGQLGKDNTVLLRVCVQILLALLPNIELTYRVFNFFILHCIFELNVKHYVSTHCSSVFPESIYIYCTVHPKVYTAESQWSLSSFVCKCQSFSL